MSITKKIIIISVFLFQVFGFAEDKDSDIIFGKVIDIKGESSITCCGNRIFPLSLDTEIYFGDIIVTSKNSEVTILMPKHSSEFTITENKTINIPIAKIKKQVPIMKEPLTKKPLVKELDSDHITYKGSLWVRQKPIKIKSLK